MNILITINKILPFIGIVIFVTLLIIAIVRRNEDSGDINSGEDMGSFGGNY